MDVAGRFGDNLVRCRKFAGLSQDELSIRASVHRTEISQLERACAWHGSTPWPSSVGASKPSPTSRWSGSSGCPATFGSVALGRWTMADGIRKRRAKDCPARKGRRCRCRGGYEARDDRRIYKTFDREVDAKSWRADAKRALDRGVLRAPTGRTLRGGGRGLACRGRAGRDPQPIRQDLQAIDPSWLPNGVGRSRSSRHRQREAKCGDHLAAAGPCG